MPDEINTTETVPAASQSETDDAERSTSGASADATAAVTDADADAGETQEPRQNREARYRVERNEARTALEAANARIEAMQRAEVERLAGELAAPTDLFAVGGAQLADLLDEAGNVDDAAVADAVAALLADRPGLARVKRDRLVDLSQGTVNRHQPDRLSWADLLRTR